jgi:hypothetical protein
MATAIEVGVIIVADENGTLLAYGPDRGLKLNQAGVLIANILRLGAMLELNAGTPARVVQIGDESTLKIRLVNGVEMKIDIVEDNYFYDLCSAL